MSYCDPNNPCDECRAAIANAPNEMFKRKSSDEYVEAPNESKTERGTDEITGITAYMMGLEPTTAGGITRSAEPPQPSVQGQQDDDEIQDVLIDVCSKHRIAFCKEPSICFVCRNSESAPSITSERIAEIAAETLEGPQAMACFNAICKALREARKET